MISEPKKEVKKLILILVTSMPVTVTKKEAIETTKTVGTDENSKGGKYLENFVQVLYIWYPTTF